MKNKNTIIQIANMPQQEEKLLVGIELSKSKWVLCFSEGKHLRHRTLAAGRQAGLLREVQLAKEKLGLAQDCEVHSCYEAGRDGFWVHRFLDQHGIQNRVLDASSIEVNRRSRPKKTDRVDAEKLVKLLVRMVLCGESGVCAQVRVPTPEQEGAMRVDRERGRLVKERSAHRNRIRSLLTLHGIPAKSVERIVPSKLVDWQGQSLAAELVAELERELQRLAQVQEQIKQLEKQQAQQLRSPQTEATVKGAKLQGFYGIGLQSSWLLSHEFFWRDFQNRRQVGSCAGLTGSPHDSGESRREQGISKAGNWRVRALSVELAWNWLRFQPQSQLSRWFLEHYGKAKARRRRMGIVALARKLLVALWKYLTFDLVPEGARLKS